jgi:hypothetical protein
MQPLMASPKKADVRVAAKAPRSRPGVAASGRGSDPDPRALVRALSREVARLPALQAELAAAEQTIQDQRRKSDQQAKRSAGTQASLTIVVETLQAISAISHGKRVDRRLAKAQKLAARALKRVENSPAPVDR